MAMAIQPPYLTRMTLAADQVDQGAYPYNALPFLRPGFEIEFERPITFLVGENGSGKTTFLRAIAANAGFHDSGGSAEHQLHDQDSAAADLGRCFRLSWKIKVGEGFFFRADMFNRVSRYVDRVGDVERHGGVPFGELSHGQGLIALFRERLTPKRRCLYLIDEPEAALSPNRQLAFLHILAEWQRSAQVQAIVATHAPIIMAYPNARILQVTETGLAPIAFEDTDHYRVTKAFLNNRDRFLSDLSMNTVEL